MRLKNTEKKMKENPHPICLKQKEGYTTHSCKEHGYMRNHIRLSEEPFSGAELNFILQKRRTLKTNEKDLVAWQVATL